MWVFVHIHFKLKKKKLQNSNKKASTLSAVYPGGYCQQRIGRKPGLRTSSQITVNVTNFRGSHPTLSKNKHALSLKTHLLLWCALQPRATRQTGPGCCDRRPWRRTRCGAPSPRSGAWWAGCSRSARGSALRVVPRGLRSDVWPGVVKRQRLVEGKKPVKTSQLCKAKLSQVHSRRFQQEKRKKKKWKKRAVSAKSVVNTFKEKHKAGKIRQQFF